MIPLRIALENFGSFTKTQEFEFPRKPGLYFMWGRNDAEPRLGANAVGKSTVWNALTWLFFGKNTDGLKASDIANWGVGKKARVVFEYEDAQGMCVVVTRTWSPNSFTAAFEGGGTIDLDKGTANPVLDALRLDFLAFTQTVVMPQSTDLFLELDSQKQTALLSEVLGLDRWIKYSESASSRARTEDLECRRLDRELSNIVGRLEQARSVDVSKAYNEFEDERDRKLALIDDQMYELGSSTVSPDREVKWATDKANDLRSVYRAKKEALREFEEKRHLAMRDYGAARASVQHAQAALEEARTYQRDPDEMNICPTCRKPMRDGVELREHNHKEITRLSNLVMQCESKEREMRAEQDQINEDFEKAREALFKAEDDLDAAEDAVKAAQRMKSEHKASWDRLESDEKYWREAVNPHKKMRDELKSTIRNLEADFNYAKKALNQAETAFVATSAWVRGFKDIRLAQIQDALDQLSIEANNQVVAVGLQDWELVFGVDRETKGGSLQRGFSTLVYSPSNKKPVPMKSWSGGETQRLVVAGQCGFSNLVRAHMGTQLNLEVWDEPTAGMSAQGVHDLLESLHTRAHTEGRQIWVIDHHTLGFMKFDGACGVIRDSEGSYFEPGFPAV